jgi:type I restriction enzyme M protein
MPEIIYSNPIDVIAFKVFGIFHAFRGNTNLNNIEDSVQIVLLLVSLHKDGVINENSFSNDFSVSKLKSLILDSSLNSEKKEIYLIIVETLNESLSILFSQPLNYFSFLLFQLEKEMLVKDFSKYFDGILFKLYDSLGKDYGQYLLPKEIRRLMFNLANVKSNSSIYNPFAGPASFGVLCDIDNHYIGQEISVNTQITGMLRLLAADANSSKQIVSGDSINNWNPTNEKFDLIISSPPFNMQLPDKISGKWGVLSRVESFAIEKGLDDLKHDGKLIILVTESFLSSVGQFANLRYHLIEQDLIESIVSLPTGVLSYSNIKTSILVINKKKDNKGFINFVNTEDFISKNVKTKTLDDVKLLEAINSNSNVNFVKKVSLEEVISNDRILESQRYFLEKIEGKKLIDFSEKIRGVRINPEGLFKIIRIKDLKNDNLNFDLDINAIENTQSNRSVFKIVESCLLLSKVGNTLKPTYFHYNNEPIFISDDIIALKVDFKIVDLEYLVNEFYAESVQNQLKAFFSGAAITRIREADLFSIKFNITSIAEQKAKIKGVKEAFIQNKKNELAFQQELLGLKDDSFREFASIKHTFRQYLNALKSNVSGTRAFIEKNQDKEIDLNMIYSKNLNKTFGEHLLGLEGTIDSMAKLLTSFDANITNNNTMEHDLTRLVEEAQNRFKNHEVFQFEKMYFDKDSFSYDYDETYIAPMISIDEDDFYRIFSNIVANAIDHGFKNADSKYSIRTSISYDSIHDMCVLEISNNGKAMPNKFTLKELTTRGEKTTDSSGSGTGGADIKDILKKYNGLLELVNDESLEYPVTYIIKLPLFKVIL